MWVVARDPSLRTGTARDAPILMAAVEVPFERLDKGPEGHRVRVVDYDSSTRTYRPQRRDPNAGPKPSWRRGDPSLLDDADFHAQNVYALVMRTLARFEFALGRRIGWAFQSHLLNVVPHAFAEPNAYYDRRADALLFGEFVGERGAWVRTCLSHDIVVHETTHALLDGLRQRYIDPSSPDQAAFHEGFADVVALLSVFSMPEVVQLTLRHLAAAFRPRRTRRRANGSAGELIPIEALDTEVLRQSALFALAAEFGRETGADHGGLRTHALRHSLLIPPAKDLLRQPEYEEAHRRGEVFAAAVMRTFLAVWADRLQELGERNAGHGKSGVSMDRIVEEGAEVASHLLTLWIRALDYMPPVDVTFGDALGAAVTADRDVDPRDAKYRCRTRMLDVFAAYGIAPPPPPATAPDGTWPIHDSDALDYRGIHLDSLRGNPDEVYRFLYNNMDALRVSRAAYCRVLSVRPCTRVGPDGFVVRETVAEYYQTIRLTPAELRKLGVEPAEPGEAGEAGEAAADGDASEIKLYAGGVLVFDEFGRLKYHVANQIFDKARQTERLRWLSRFEPLQLRAGSFAQLHRLRSLHATTLAAEQW